MSFTRRSDRACGQTQTVKTEISAIQVDNDDQHDLSRWTEMSNCHDEIRRHRRVVTDLKTGIIGSYYSIQKKPAGATTKTDDWIVSHRSYRLARAVPLAASSRQSMVLEPRMQLVYVGGPDMTDDIPNRDSADYRIDEAICSCSTDIRDMII